MNIHCLPHVALLSATIFLAGCATNKTEVNTWRDTQFSPAVTNTIAMTDRPKPTAEDAELGQILATEM
jgi:hypothetical protein